MAFEYKSNRASAEAEDITWKSDTFGGRGVTASRVSMFDIVQFQVNGLL